ncbi:hypothetical protein GCM10010377_52610 [Streptomyces viridiviolaceus]|nr:hypothetical protein GCM10010377_52610 [Streptomyces viridiviolaceus]
MGRPARPPAPTATPSAKPCPRQDSSTTGWARSEAALIASLLLRRRNAVYRRLSEKENLDTDADGIPHMYQRTEAGGA